MFGFIITVVAAVDATTTLSKDNEFGAPNVGLY